MIADPTPADDRPLRLLVEDTAEYALVALDPEGKVVSWNAGAERILGWTEAEAAGRLFPAVPEAEADEFRSRLSRVLAGEMVASLELRLRRKGGTRVDVTLSASATRDEDGRVTGVAGVLADISERKRAETSQRLLAEAGRTLSSSLDYGKTLHSVARLTAESVADWCAIDVLEDEGRVRAVEIAASDPATEERLRELLRRYPPDPSVENDPVGRVLRTGEPELIPEITAEDLSAAAVDEEHEALLRELAPRSLMIVPLQARERVLGAITLYAAGSDRRFSESDLAFAAELASRAALAVDNARLYRAAQRAVRVRDDVLGIVAHDLRNPLNTIIMGAGLIRDAAQEKPDGEFTLRMARSVLRSADAMNRLIQDLLDVAKIESGTFSVQLRSYRVASLLREALDQFGGLGAERSTEIAAEPAGEIPPVAADLDRVLQLFSNLIGNAVKFSDEGGRVVLGARAAGDRVVFSVSDHGSGIPPESIPHLFDRFWQARSHRRGGAGLGLTICKGIVAAHGGEMWVESEVGRGSTFFFSLPTAEDLMAEGGAP